MTTYKKLENSELSNANEADYRRKVQDDAKKRAISTLCDYDTFKNMVSVAHLKPINAPNEGTSVNSAPSRVFAADGSLVSTGQVGTIHLCIERVPLSVIFLHFGGRMENGTRRVVCACVPLSPFTFLHLVSPTSIIIILIIIILLHTNATICRTCRAIFLLRPWGRRVT